MVLRCETVQVPNFIPAAQGNHVGLIHHAARPHHHIIRLGKSSVPPVHKAKAVVTARPELAGTRPEIVCKQVSPWMAAQRGYGQDGVAGNGIGPAAFAPASALAPAIVAGRGKRASLGAKLAVGALLAAGSVGGPGLVYAIATVGTVPSNSTNSTLSNGGTGNGVSYSTPSGTDNGGAPSMVNVPEPPTFAILAGGIGIVALLKTGRQRRAAKPQNG